MERYKLLYCGLQKPVTPRAYVGEQLEAVQAVFVAPDPDMPHKVASAAWPWLDTFDAYDE